MVKRPKSGVSMVMKITGSAFLNCLIWFGLEAETSGQRIGCSIQRRLYLRGRGIREHEKRVSGDSLMCHLRSDDAKFIIIQFCPYERRFETLVSLSRLIPNGVFSAMILGSPEFPEILLKIISVIQMRWIWRRS